ncbi:MAG: hypothetical protein JAZ04_17175 [Candidatus Thiodiazotropha lotti]|uniref:DNA helicase DnaB-like N-terminal domain-containing protein n=1 Tax=Candidatus Thiodiazotropha lotti TaxID=2792787 RepID=A0A9E4K6Z7_9GAMM|nr:hypothetical protein [Candidatus Thiodiazotropha lotti]
MRQLVFRAIKQLTEKEQPLDVITFSEELECHDQMEEAGGLAYLGSQAKDTPNAANIRSYSDIARESIGDVQLIRAQLQTFRLAQENTPCYVRFR